ncbi:hypothetical protein [Flavobacterium sp. JP2137]|uniref:hypothetical protein n=1 Tax=Flavobacterium sp. JP2137 TaxID=3414510 RepID=UPI003D300A48
MEAVKKQIGWLFLWVFLMPQGNNALHYWVIKHDFRRTQPTTPEFLNKSTAHYCDHSLFKMPSMLLSLVELEWVHFNRPFNPQPEQLRALFEQSSFVAYYLRGPPRFFE